MPENPSSNIFVQHMSQFRVLESVPDVIQQIGSSTEQHDTSHTANAVAIENTNQATDASNMDLIAQAREVVDVNSLHPTPSELASTSASTSNEVPQAGNPIPNPSHTSVCTSPDPTTSPTMSASTSTLNILNDNPAFRKVMHQKRYLHKAKMEPGVAVTVR